MQILHTLLPLFLIIGLGAALERGGFFTASLVAGMNQLAYWIGLPVLVFVSLATAEHGEGASGALLGALALGTSLSVVLAWALARVLRVRPEAVGTFVQGSFRGNLTFVGLPILLTLPGVPLTAAMLALAPVLVMYNLIAVSFLLASRHGMTRRALPAILRETLKNPIIVSSVLGGVFYAANWRLGLVWERTLSPLAHMAVPLALLGIGSALAGTRLQGDRRLAVTAACFKSVLSPLLGLLMATWLGLDPGERRVVLLLMACPTATASYTMVSLLGGDEALAASSIALSAFGSAATLAAIVTWF